MAAEQLAAAAAAGPGGAGPGPLDPAGVAAGAGGDAGGLFLEDGRQGVHTLLGSGVAGFALVEAYGAAKTTACKYCSAPLLPPGVACAERPAPESGGAGLTARAIVNLDLCSTCEAVGAAIATGAADAAERERFTDPCAFALARSLFSDAQQECGQSDPGAAVLVGRLRRALQQKVSPVKMEKMKEEPAEGAAVFDEEFERLWAQFEDEAEEDGAAEADGAGADQPAAPRPVDTDTARPCPLFGAWVDPVGPSGDAAEWDADFSASTAITPM